MQSILPNFPFDAVVMLTWSDWATEPRSNRYHYATRFARRVPVYFVQPDAGSDEVVFEDVPDHNIIIVHVTPHYGARQAELLAGALYTRGVKRPLLWIYNVYFEHYVRRSTSLLKVFHATEDYLTEPGQWSVAGNTVRLPCLRVLNQIDLLVAVSEGVADSYLENRSFKGATLVLRNGCDFTFWNASGASRYIAPDDGAKVVFYQGGINARLDYELLERVTELLPDWQFWFCGQARDGGPGWEALLARANVHYWGERDTKGIAELASRSLVGLIPFKQDDLIRRSLPLKAFEYVGCGLPVVTVPIDELRKRRDLFQFETTPEGFARAITECASKRMDQALLTSRGEAARAESYDERFKQLLGVVEEIAIRRSKAKARLNLLLFYDDRSTHVRTIVEHIEAFQKYSRHEVHLAPATGSIAGVNLINSRVNLGAYDAVLIHYSVRVSMEDHFSPTVVEAIAAYDGPKLLFLQDEYENTDIAQSWIRRLGISTVYTVVPSDQIARAYPPQTMPAGVSFVSTLTGYVPEDPSLDDYVMPIPERHNLIGYRGRQLPHHYGELGQDKYRIGVEMRRLAQERGLPVDIEVDDSRRIYGNDWYRFLGSCRATLGTESGANVFDRDGSLKRLAARNPAMRFDEYAQRYLIGREGEVRMNQVSPKIFEAIRLRTALVLFEGEYSGVVEPDQHFIPLKKNFSNVAEVFEKVLDVDYLASLTERAYRDVIGGGRYSYEAFVRSVDTFLDDCTSGRPRARIVSVPLFAHYGDGDAVALWPGGSMGGLVNGAILNSALPREEVLEFASEILKPANEIPKPAKSRSSLAFRTARKAWRTLPMPLRSRFAGIARYVLLRL